jgi:acyl carrier protein
MSKFLVTWHLVIDLDRVSAILGTDDPEIAMIDQIRALLDAHGRLPVPAASLADTQDLYAVGLTSFAAVQLMLGLEDTFDVEFPERMLNRRSFASITAMAACLGELVPERMAS